MAALRREHGGHVRPRRSLQSRQPQPQEGRRESHQEK